MEEEEHEVYGGEIPVEAEMDADVDMSVADDDAVKVLPLALLYIFQISSHIPIHICMHSCLYG